MVHKGERYIDPAVAERARLEAFEANGGLDRWAYAMSPGMADYDTRWLEEAYAAYETGLAGLARPELNETGFSAENGYYGSPDCDVSYQMTRSISPKRVVEVGSGHSTRVARQAILDGHLSTKLSAIDPYPRKDIAHLVDQFEQKALEEVDDRFFSDLESGDILFIDSSHQVRMSNDVARLFCRIIPALAQGVVLHVHDVFLPYEYPKRFFYDCPSWGEQYVLHALLQSGDYDILWPGYYVQRDRPECINKLPFLANGSAQSFWIRKRR